MFRIIIEIRKYFPLLIHEHELCHGNSGICRLEIPELGFDIAAIYFMIKTFFNNLFFNYIPENIGKGKKVKMIDIPFSYA